MGLLDDHNTLHGTFGSPTRRRSEAERVRTSRRWAIIGIVAALLWLGGIFSLVAVFCGLYALMEARHVGASKVLPAIAMVLGVVGLVAALVIGLVIIDDDTCAPATQNIVVCPE